MPYSPVLEDLTALGDELAELGDDVLMGATKAGARHSADDNQMLQEIAEAASDILDLAIELGADDPDGEASAVLMDEATVKAIYDDPAAYAQHECQDIAQACAALQAMAMLMQSELSEGHEEDEEGTIAQLSAGMRTLTDFIRSEIDAIEGAGETKAQQTFGGKKREDLEDSDFGDVENRKYPIMTAKDVKDAARLIGKAKDADAVKKRIIAIAKRKGFEDALPFWWRGATKGIEFVSDELAVCPGYSVKAIAGDEGAVGGYLVKFGGDGDLSQWRDIFERKSSDFGRAQKTDVYVHHRMLPGLGKRRLTHQADIGIDDVGVFIKHLLDLRDPYEKALYGLTQQGKLGFSSGTAPHLVDRKAIEDGRHLITHWPLGLDASYTPTPAGGLEVNASAMKSLFDEAGLDLLAAIYDTAAAKADDRQRALLLEIGLLELETA